MACRLQEVMLCCQGNLPLREVETREVVTRLWAGPLVVHCPLLGVVCVIAVCHQVWVELSVVLMCVT